MLAPDVSITNPSGRISHILVIHSADAAFKSNLRLRALNSLLAKAALGRKRPLNQTPRPLAKVLSRSLGPNDEASGPSACKPSI